MTMAGYTTAKAVKVKPMVNALVASQGTRGLTIGELRDVAQGYHHGTLSGSLSSLHRDGVIAMLDEKRNGNLIYVAPENINNRPTRAQGRNNGGSQ